MGKGGGSPGPQQNTTVTSNIPEYAKPYVTNMFEATQQQLFTGNKGADGGYNITGFRGYNPYSTDVNNYYAGFSPLQQQAQFDAGAMQQPGQFALGSGLTGAAGMRSLQAGNQYAQNVTNKQRVDASGKPMFDQYNNPMFDASNTTQSYMSPYQQNVTDFAKQSAVRESQMAQQAQNLGAARQGTYGGARQLLANTERERNLLTNLSNIQTQGSQSAYDKAMQAQQYGANLGMQGLGQAMGAGAQLGQLGGAQQAADIARQNQMSTMGGQQQALEQSKINQAIQDYGTQQQYPLMQLGFMSNMLRGLPMEASNRATYQAAPNALSQLGGLGMTGLGIYGMSGGFKGAKEGGLMAAKEYKEGGLAYAEGGDISSMSDEQLVEMLKNPFIDPMLRAEIEKILRLHQRMAMNPQTEQIMAPSLGRSGIASIGTGDMVPEQMPAGAGGGIVAFATGNVVNLKKQSPADALDERIRSMEEREAASYKNLYENANAFEKSNAVAEDIRKQIASSKEKAPYEALTMAGLAALQGSPDPATRQNFLGNLAYGAEKGLGAYSKSGAEQNALNKLLLTQGVEQEKAKYGRDVSAHNALQSSLGQAYNRKLLSAQIGAGAEDKALLKVQALINQDDQLPLLYKQRDMYEPKDPNYKAYNDAINAIKKAYFEQAGIKRPFVAPPGVQLAPEPEKKGFFSGLFGGSKSEASKDTIIDFNKLPTKG
jgi:hypothetical protein